MGTDMIGLSYMCPQWYWTTRACVAAPVVLLKETSRQQAGKHHGWVEQRKKRNVSVFLYKVTISTNYYPIRAHMCANLWCDIPWSYFSQWKSCCYHSNIKIRCNFFCTGMQVICKCICVCLLYIIFVELKYICITKELKFSWLTEAATVIDLYQSDVRRISKTLIGQATFL
jgi:hypothetical protein